MKIIKQIILAVTFLLTVHLTAKAQFSFSVDPILVELGNVSEGDQIEFSITVINQKENGGSINAFNVSIYDPQGVADWVSSLNPSSFYILKADGDDGALYEEYTQVVTISGIYGDVLGYQSFYVDFYDSDNTTITVPVRFTGVPPGGPEDYIMVTDADTEITEQDQLYYAANFIDMYPYGGNITDWNLKLVLFSNEGDYNYIDIDKNQYNNVSWECTAPLLPNDLTFHRNSQGQIMGDYRISGTDNDTYYHYAGGNIGINKEPDESTFRILYLSPTSVELQYLNTGGLSNYIYYGDESGSTYNGTGLDQGDSPINNGNNTSIELTGLQQCEKYFFSGIAQNNQGSSEYWDEKEVLIFETPNQSSVFFHSNDVFMYNDYTFNDNHLFSGDLIIESGATVTFNGGYIYFYEDSKIIIQQGGELILNGTTCTAPCGQMWQGIEVWGNKNKSQHALPDSLCAQGKLTLRNNALIENAAIAVNLWKPNDWSTTGGIVSAKDAIFRNNAKSVHALHYSNFDPLNPESEWPNYSIFRNCTFEITADYLGNVTFHKHVDLSHVRGIYFFACDFYMEDNVEGVSQWNSAIAAYDAGFWVVPVCNSYVQPCQDYDSCHFAGFYSAISASCNNTTNTFRVNRAVFNNNTYGVKVNGVDYATVLFSTFNIGEDNTTDLVFCSTKQPEEMYGAPGTGIYMKDATGFAIEENHFNKYANAPSGNYTGISINNTEDSDEIYKNYFTGLSYGNYSEGKNWKGNTFEGLTYFCNENTDNYADFYVSLNENDVGGIQSEQGDIEHVAGNTFSSTGATHHFYNGGNHLIAYYYCDDDDCTDEEPDEDLLHNVFPVAKNFDNSCYSHYGLPERNVILTSGQKQETEQEFYANLTDYNNVKSLYDNLVDGGSTEDELSDIKTAQPDDMWELRAQLLGKSPHLSMVVLKEAADKTDVFTEAALFDILAANPDELKKDELMTYLEEKVNPLPDYMIDILRQVATGITYKTVLQQQMARYNRSKTRAAHDIIRSILNDSITDYTDLRNWLDNLGGITADRQIIASYTQEGNYTDALSLAGMLPALYKLEGDELVEHNYYVDFLNFYLTLEQQDRNTHQLNGTEIDNLELIAESSKGIAGSQAKSILESVYGHHYINCNKLEGTAGFKRGNISIDALGQVYGIDISVKPNPAKQWAAFDYTLPENEIKATITITDVTGKTMEILSVSGQQGQKLWDTRRFEPGIYLYTLKTGGLSKSGKIIIQH